MQNSTSKLQKIINAHRYPEIQTVLIMTKQCVSIGHCQMTFIISNIQNNINHRQNDIISLLPKCYFAFCMQFW